MHLPTVLAVGKSVHQTLDLQLRFDQIKPDQSGIDWLDQNSRRSKRDQEVVGCACLAFLVM